jgi:glycosyltransferase involved in cell wall biosynthesis
MFILVLAWRLAVGYLQRALFLWDRGVYRTIIVGTESHAHALATALQKQRWMGHKVLGLVECPADIDASDAPRQTSTFPILGKAAELSKIAAQFNADVIWLTLPGATSPKILNFVLATPDLPVKWAMARSEAERLFQAILSAPQLVGLYSCTEDELATQLTQRLDRYLEPLAGPRITFVGSRGIPATYGGVERYVEELGIRLAQHGYQVSVYCRPHYTSRRGNYRGIELRYLPCTNTKHLEAISHTLLATLHLLFCEDEIVHYQALGPSLLAWLPRLLGRKTIVTVQGLDWQRSKWGPIAQTVLKVGEWASVYLPHQTIVVSQDLKEYFQDRYKKKVTYVPNGVNIAQQRSAREIYKLGLEEGNYVLAVGRLVPEKGYHTLIRAFRQVQTDKRLVITGGSSHSQAYVASLHAMAKDAPILFTGYIYERALEELYSNAYLFLSASETEGLPITLLEALSFGACPLVSDIPPHVEVLGGLGYTFRTGDEKDLAVKLQALLDAPQAVARAGDALRQRAVTVYSWESVTNATEAIYQEMLVSQPDY